MNRTGERPRAGGEPRPPLLTRRGLLIGAATLGGGTLGLLARPATARLRPPGALPEPDFTRRCIRCLRCAEVCPPGAIRFEASPGLAGSDTPYIEPRCRSCLLCMRCTHACPSGALTPTDPDPQVIQSAVRIGRPELNRRTCIAWRESGECRACYYVCPYAGSAVRLEGLALGPLFDPEACVGCGQCEESCPEAMRAIRIVSRYGARR